MPRQAIEQATCTECGQSEENYLILDSTIETDDDDDDSTEVVHDLKCTCGETPTVRITESGIEGSESISHEDASWNQEGDSDE